MNEQLVCVGRLSVLCTSAILCCLEFSISFSHFSGFVFAVFSAWNSFLFSVPDILLSVFENF